MPVMSVLTISVTFFTTVAFSQRGVVAPSAVLKVLPAVGVRVPGVVSEGQDTPSVPVAISVD